MVIVFRVTVSLIHIADVVVLVVELEFVISFDSSVLVDLCFIAFLELLPNCCVE